MEQGAATQLGLFPQARRGGILVNPKKSEGMSSAQYCSLIKENKASRGGQVYGLRQQRLSYKKIGEILDPPVSAERVRQILARHERFLEAWNNLKNGGNTGER